MKEIKLTQGKVVLVDDEDFERLNQWKWYAENHKNTFYVKRQLPRINGKQCSIYMHNVIIDKSLKGLETDHRDGNGLNNQKENLRHVTLRQNQQNRKHQNSSSQYPGVHWNRASKSWMARIHINGIRKYLGVFANETEAFFAYKQAVENIGEKVIEDF